MRSKRPVTPLGLTLRSGLTGVIIAAPFALGLSAGFGGVRGLFSSLAGLLLVAVFFLVSMVLVERANTVGPALTLPVALTVYGIKIIILGVIVFGTNVMTHVNAPAFCWSVVAATLSWLVAHATGVWRTRMPYVVISPDVTSSCDSLTSLVMPEPTTSGSPPKM